MLHGQVRYNLRSRFLEEIPEGLTKWLTPPNPRRSFVSEPSPRYYNPGAAKPAAPACRRRRRRNPAIWAACDRPERAHARLATG
jgi:DNA helicase-2/ATP-dependent DNA helicase PcrA